MRRAARGQAALEFVVAVPLLLAAALLAWQLAAVVWAGMQAQERARREALQATPPPGRTHVVTASVTVPALLLGADGLVARARVGVRAPAP